MQGGRSLQGDPLDPLDSCCGTKGDADAGYESDPGVVVREISLSQTADRFITSARQFVVSLLAKWLVLSLTFGTRSVESFKRHKLDRVASGTKMIVKLQKALRTPFLDVYFQAWSFCAEEEFYLIITPLLFWEVDTAFARHFNFIVLYGLFVGNLLKDVFELPRPDPREVWRAHGVESTDSTQCQDFGYPSTHAMNSLSNSMFAILEEADPSNLGSGFAVALLVAAVWIFSISFGRLYLGVHSPTDLRGGFMLGLWITVLWCYMMNAVDTAIMFGGPFLCVGVVLSFVFVLILCPQPRPVTPTFMQNALIAGLLSGSIIGSNFFMQHAGTQAAVVESAAGSNWLAEALAGSSQLTPKPKSRAAKDDGKGASKAGRSRPRSDSFEINGWFIFARAAVKFVTYTNIAIMITFVVPVCFQLAGISSPALELASKRSAAQLASI
eukprot:g2072.t1